MDNITKDSERLIFCYKFMFDSGIEKEFKIVLDKKNLNLIQKEESGEYSEWTKLNFFKCSNCPLDEKKHEFCPTALSLVDVFKSFSSFISYDKVTVIIETEARKYMKHTTVQNALSSLMGIYMVTTGCPIMEKLKPMICYHLPFATEEETKYRVLTMYLFAQYFLFKKGKKPDWELKKLVDIYNDIQIVNKNFCKRISAIQTEDASINALIVLDCFVSFVTFAINQKMPDQIENLFSAYLEG
ncbi:hypothetical protein KAU39_01455 [bacterium]|nr:hypothetical protein [bacterium]